MRFEKRKEINMKLRTRTAGLLVAAIACLSMAVSPVFMSNEQAMASEVDTQDVTGAGLVMTDEMYDQIDGKYVKDLQADPEMAVLMDDPTFLRYFDIADNGKITKKQVETDEVDQFIAEMDANAEGISDSEIVEMNSDMSCMGCGVSGLGKAQMPGKYCSQTRYHCIDISYWQGKITDANWQKIRNAGVTHVILRVGYSGLSNGKHNPDSVFDNNIRGAYKAGLKIGVYYYSTATTSSEALSEAKYTVELLKNYKDMITLPVAFDYETGGRLSASVMKKSGNASCTAYCDYIKSSGYTPMVYANYVTLTNYLDYKTLEGKYPIWLANYTTSGSATTYPGNYCIWQYSSSGKVNGLSGSIDINYVFNNGQGGFTAEGTNPSMTATVPSSTEKSYKIITRSKMNIRTGPSTSKKKVGTVTKGKAVYATSINGSWAKLTNGYYMSLSSCKFVAKTTTSVNYRTGPGTKYKKKGTYSKGKTITVISIKNGWAKMDNGRWLSAKYIKIQ
ncbi:MAG: GH25 family lysozyme [Bacillota bacterium]|nr:GH25 family lysozyme [Bacillota bacterium]